MAEQNTKTLSLSKCCQTDEAADTKQNDDSSTENLLLLTKIKSLERSLMNSEVSCAELEEQLRERDREIMKLRILLKDKDSNSDVYNRSNIIERSGSTFKMNNDAREIVSPRSMSTEKKQTKLSIPKLSLITIINAKNPKINLLKSSPQTSERKLAYYSQIYKKLKNSPVPHTPRN